MERKQIIIKGTLYKLTEKNLLCEWPDAASAKKRDNNAWGLDFPDQTRLYAPGSEFILDSVINGERNPRKIDEAEARRLMDEHPAGVRVDAYKRRFGDPPEVE